MIRMKLSIVVFILMILGINALEYPLLNIKLLDYQDGTILTEIKEELIKLNLSEFVSLSVVDQHCKDHELCPIFYLYDAYQDLLQSYQGEATLKRYMTLVNKYIQSNKYKIKENKVKGLIYQTLQNQDLEVAIFKQTKMIQDHKRKELLRESQINRKKHHDSTKKENKKNHEVQNVNKTQKNQEQKSQLKEKLQLSSELPKQAEKNMTTKVPLSINEKTVETSQQSLLKKKKSFSMQQTSIWTWRLSYILIIICLFFGMKYLNRQQQQNSINFSQLSPNNDNDLPQQQELNDLNNP